MSQLSRMEQFAAFAIAGINANPRWDKIDTKDKIDEALDQGMRIEASLRIIQKEESPPPLIRFNLDESGESCEGSWGGSLSIAVDWSMDPGERADLRRILKESIMGYYLSLGAVIELDRGEKK